MAAISETIRGRTSWLTAARVPRSSMRLFALMANGNEGGDECRPLSIRQAADHMGIAVDTARACFKHPRAWQTVLRLVDERSGRIGRRAISPQRIAVGLSQRLRTD